MGKGYKRTTYIINPKFQIRFAIYICVIVCISSSIYPLTIYDIYVDFMQFAALKSPEKLMGLEQKKDALIFILALWQLGLTSLIFIISILFGHRIAGPIFKVKKYLTAIRKNKVHGKLSFRKGDYFQDLADDLNLTFQQLEDRYHQDLVYMGQIAEYLDKIYDDVPEQGQEVIAQIQQRIAETQRRFQES